MNSQKSGEEAKEECEGPSLSKARVVQRLPGLLERVVHLVEEA